MSLSLVQLRDSVYRRLGDAGYPDLPVFATVEAVDETINDVVADLVYDIEARGHQPLVKQAKIYASADYSFQKIDIVGATSGSYTLTWLGRTTGSIAKDASSSEFKAELDLIDDLTFGAFTVTSGGGGSSHKVKWLGSPLDPLPLDQSVLRPVIPAITVDGSGLGGPSASASVALTADGDEAFRQEYRLDQYLIDSNQQPDFRGNLFIERTDVTVPVPVEWPERGNYRLRNEYGRVTPRFPSENATNNAQIPHLYRRGQTIGYVYKQSETQTLTATYSPIVPKLVNPADTLGDLRLGVLEPYKNVIVLKTARRLHGDKASSLYQIMSAEYVEEYGRFITNFSQNLRVSSHQRRRQ